jgi:hypothetical protein
MARQTVAFTNFTAGELSPRLDGRTDLTKYFNGSKTLQNMVVHPHGGASRRPGTKFIHEVKSSSAKTRLIPFEFSTTQTYVLELGNEYMRFYKDGGIITEGNKTISAITKANPAVVTATSHGYSDGDHVIISSVVGMVQVNNRTFKVANKTTNTFELQDVDGNNIDSSDNYQTYSSAGVANKIYEIATPYTTANIPTVKFAQSADLMYLVHPSYAIRQLTRTGHTSWTLTAPTLTTSADKTVSGVTKANPGVVTTSTDHGYTEGDFVTFTNIGGMTQLNGNVYKVGTVGSTTTFNLQDSGGTNLNTGSYGTFSAGGSDTVNKLTDPVLNTTTDYYPSSVTFFEQRLVFAGSNNNPQSVWFSKSADYTNFTTGVNDTDAMVYTIASNKVNAIRFMSAQRSLIIGTVGGEFVVSASGTTSPITPTNIQIQRQTAHGAANQDAIQIENVTMFLQRAKRKIRELTYNLNIDQYQTQDMTLLAEHITDGGIVEMAYQQEPDSILWCVRTDGTLLGFTYARAEEVVGWHKHILGGVFGEATITVSDYGNIATGTTITITKSDGSSVTFTSEAAGGTSPSESTGWRPNEGNNTTADNIYTAVNAHADFTVANPSAAVVTIKETSKTGTSPISITSSDSTRLTTANEGQAVVESVATIPTDSNEDELYLIVKRTIDGTTRRYVEFLQNFDYGTDQADGFYVDSGLTYSGSSTTAITGLEHLEGESVTILADGSSHPVKSISSGAIMTGGSLTLDRSATKAQIGLPYDSVLQTMRIESQSEEGTSQSRTKRINEVTIRLHETVGVEVGPSLSDMERIPFRSSAASMDTAVPLFTGDKQVEFRDDFNTDGYIYVRQTQPLPLTILSIYPRITVNSG